MQAVEELQKTTVLLPGRKKFSVAETRKMMEIGILPEESGWELINGEIVCPMTIGSRHAGLVNKLNRTLTIMLGTNAIVAVQNPIHIDDYNEPEPDIALLKPRDDFYAESLPMSDDVLLIVEVSDSTLSYDQEFKKKLYAAAAIPEFWLVNLKQNTIETYFNPANSEYYQMQIYGRGETVSSRNVSFVSLPVSEILGEERQTEN